MTSPRRQSANQDNRDSTLLRAETSDRATVDKPLLTPLPQQSEVYEMARDLDQGQLQALASNPSESLAVECKSWLDLQNPSHVARLVKAVLALRNHGGGFLLIGIENAAGSVSNQNTPADVRAAYHVDVVQGLISRFASSVLEIQIDYVTVGTGTIPIVTVPSGVRTPVVAKARLLAADGTLLIEQGDLYIRTLSSNNTPSTSKITWKDWDRLIETCFENREADVARFIRKHLSAPGVADAIRQAIDAPSAGSRPPARSTLDVLADGERALRVEAARRQVTIPPLGSWEVAAKFSDFSTSHVADRSFLNLLESSNPDYTGWPVWMDSSGFDSDDRPFVMNDAWEALIDATEDLFGHFDFMRLDPNGEFYLYRSLQDDNSKSDRSPEPGTALDFGLVVLRTAEAIAVGLSFARALSASGGVEFSFRWRGLTGRALSSWAQPRRQLSYPRVIRQPEVASTITVPAETPHSAIAPFVASACAPLFRAFDGFVLSNAVVEDLVAQLVQRRLS